MLTRGWAGAVMATAALAVAVAACGDDDDGTEPAAPAEEGAPADWSYEGEDGPEAWGDLDAAFAACEEGERQSPIDLAGPAADDLADPAFTYRPSTVDVVDNGHTVQGTVAAGNLLDVDGRRYELAQLHFHAPSEHTIDGEAYDMEMHLVHLDEDGAIAVVAVMIADGAALQALRSFWDDVPEAEGASARLEEPVDLSALLPEGLATYRYEGSLTTPPCTEGVAWYVLAEPIEMDADQIEAFTERHGGNDRPQAPADDRPLTLDPSD